MAFEFSSLWRAPKVNPVNRKARSIPILNPLNRYGRVFFLSWFGYFICFWSWYAFSPLTTITIKKDLRLTQMDIANANIMATSSTVITRSLAGFACDRYGPRLTFITILLLGAIPTGLAGTVQNATDLIVLRCFAGILGGGFVPCEVWTTAFYDKNVIGAANALAAGWANMGSGITYYAMPAIFDSLVNDRHLTPHVAWRVTFLVPFTLIVVVAMLMLFFGEDSPSGAWSSRQRALNRQMARRDLFISPANRRPGAEPAYAPSSVPSGTLSLKEIELKEIANVAIDDNSQPVDKLEEDLMIAASWELVQKPSVKQSTAAATSIHTIAIYSFIFCTSGIELLIVSILGAYYYERFPSLGQTKSGDFASIFGLLDIVSRPIGGIVSDALYRPSGSLWSRKLWIHFVSMVAGMFLIAIGLTDPRSEARLIGLMVGLGFFTEAGNGAIFALSPHLFPASNGIITGFAGAAGSLGAVVFSLIARHEGTNYPRLLWIMGIWTIGTQVLTVWIPPISKHQLGGR